MGTGSIDIGIEDTNFVDIGLVDIEKVGIEIALTQLVSSLQSSLSRHPSFSLAAFGILCNPSDHGLNIYKIYNID